jgi:hypothetical protein
MLEIDVLPELIKYRDILIELAEEVWRRQNPDKAYLPKGFRKNIRLAFQEMRAGSTRIPLVRLIEADDDALEFHTPDEVDRAAELIDATFLAASNDEPLPEDLPVRIIPMFEGLGKTLRDDEGIETVARDPAQCARFDPRIRQRIIERVQEAYEDLIDLEGEVRAAALRTSDGGTFRIHLGDGVAVEGAFTPEQEGEVTEALHKHHELRIRVRGLGEFARNGRIQRILRVDALEKHSVQEDRFDPNAEPIWKVIAAMGASVPEEERAKIPRDASINLDYYLYGSKKEEP